MFSGKGVLVEGGTSGGEDEGSVALVAATPGVGMAGGGHLSSSLLLPVCCVWATASAVEPQPFALGQNQKETSSVAPSVSKTYLAGITSLLQHTHAKYWLYLCARLSEGGETSISFGVGSMDRRTAAGCRLLSTFDILGISPPAFHPSRVFLIK